MHLFHPVEKPLVEHDVVAVLRQYRREFLRELLDFVVRFCRIEVKKGGRNDVERFPGMLHRRNGIGKVGRSRVIHNGAYLLLGIGDEL